MERRDFLRYSISASGLLIGPHAACADHPVLVSAERALREGKLHLGPFALRAGSAGEPYSLQTYADLRSYLRAEVRHGERAHWDDAMNRPVERAEVVVVQGKGEGRVPYGQEFGQEWSMMIERVPDVPAQWCSLWQHHQSGDHPSVRIGVNPPFTMAWDTEGRRGLSILTRSSSNARLRTSGYIPPRLLYTDPEYPLGRWVHWRGQFCYGWREGAQVRLWRDNRQVVAGREEVTLGYEWDAGPQLGVYAQFGIYRADRTRGGALVEPMIVHYRDYNMSVGKNE